MTEGGGRTFAGKTEGSCLVPVILLGFANIVFPLFLMSLPGHRRTSSHKRRRASHFALKPIALVIDKATGLTHLPHRAAPGALEYNGIAIHVKGRDRKVAKLLAKSRSKTEVAKTHDHDHAGHDHSHSDDVKA